MVMDVICMLAFAAVFYKYSYLWFPMLLGSFFSILPDLLLPLYRHAFLKPFETFHEMVHWKKEKANQWSWYIVGLASQIIISLLALAIMSAKQDVPPLTSFHPLEFAPAQTVAILHKFSKHK